MHAWTLHLSGWVIAIVTPLATSLARTTLPVSGVTVPAIGNEPATH